MPGNMESRQVAQENGEYIITVTPLKFSHPIVEKVARSLGFPGGFPTDKPGVDRSQFVAAYEAEKKKQVGQSTQIKLVSDYVEAEKIKQLLMQGATVTKSLPEVQ